MARWIRPYPMVLKMIKILNKPKQKWVEDPKGQWVEHKSIIKRLKPGSGVAPGILYTLNVFNNKECMVTGSPNVYLRKDFILMKLETC